MKLNSYLSIPLSIIVFFLSFAGIAQASTTISTNIVTGGSLSVSATTTLASSLNGLLASINGLVYSIATSSLGLSTSSISGLGTLSGLNSINNSNWSGTPLSVANGGTGTTTTPGLNQILIGNAFGGFSYISTSSLGIAGNGVNYFTNSGLNTFLNTGSNFQSATIQATSTTGTSTLPNLSSTNISTTNLAIGGLSSSFLAVDPFGNVIATTTPVGTGSSTNYFVNSGSTTTLSTGANLVAGSFVAASTTGTSTLSNAQINNLITATAQKISLKPSVTYTICTASSTNNSGYAFASSTAASRGSSECDYTVNGSNDDQVIQSVINLASSSPNGAKIFLAEGTYYIYNSIRPENNIWIQGAGMGKTYVEGMNSIGLHSIFDATYNATIPTGPGNNVNNPLMNFEMSDMTIDGTNMYRTTYTTAVKGIYIVGLTNAIFTDLQIQNIPATCLGTDFYVNGIITNNIIGPCGTQGESTALGGNGIGIGTEIDATSSEPLIIANNVTENIYDAGILLENQDAPTTYTTPLNNVIANNMSYGNYDGIRISGTGGVTITGNVSVNNTNDGISIGARAGYVALSKYITISSNYVSGNIYAGIELTQNANNTVVTGNVVYANVGNGTTPNSGTYGGYGIIALGSDSLISNNEISNNAAEGIYMPIATSTDSIRIIGNDIFNNGQNTATASSNGVGIKYYYAQAGATVNYVEISNNKIWDNEATPKQTYGIFMSTSTANGTLSILKITNNSITGNLTAPTKLNSDTTGAITADGMATNLVVFGNTTGNSTGFVIGAIPASSPANGLVVMGNAGFGTTTASSTVTVVGTVSIASSTAPATSYINQLVCFTAGNVLGHMSTTTAATTGICTPN